MSSKRHCLLYFFLHRFLLNPYIDHRYLNSPKYFARQLSPECHTVCGHTSYSSVLLGRNAWTNQFYAIILSQEKSNIKYSRQCIIYIVINRQCTQVRSKNSKFKITLAKVHVTHLIQLCCCLFISCIQLWNRHVYLFNFLPLVLLNTFEYCGHFLIIHGWLLCVCNTNTNG